MDAFVEPLQIRKDCTSIVTSSTIPWTRPQTRLLIKEFAKYPCLYELEDPNYKNKKKRKEKLNFILAKLNKVKSDVTIRCIKSKIRTLQSQLSKERKNLKKYHSDTDEMYVPKLWCFNEMSFLNDSIAARQTSSPMMDAFEAPDTENNGGAMKGVKQNDGSTALEAKWKQEEVLLFLKELEKYPCLYNPTDNYFANKKKRDEQLNIMLPHIKKFKSDVTIKCIVKKIRSLQVQICRETRALKQTRPGEVYEPRLWCYKELSFMINCRDSMRDWSIGSSDLELSEPSEEDDDQDEPVEQFMMVDPVWSRKQTLLLISEFQKYPCLYNSADKHFTNKKVRTAKVNLMLPVIKQCKPDVTVINIKQKIRTLQSQLSKEKKHKRTAELKGKEYSPKLWCYNELLFIVKPECNKLQPSSSEKELSKESIEIPSIQLNTDKYGPVKSETRFEEHETETLFKPNLSYTKLEVKNVANEDFELESQSNECNEVESLPKDDSEESNSDIQNVSKEEEFCRYLCSQLKKIQSDDNLEYLKLEILQLVSKKIKEEKRMKQQKKCFEFNPVQTTEVDLDTQTAPSYLHSKHLINQPVSKVIVEQFSKVKSETKTNIKWPSTSGSIYSIAHQSSTPYRSPVDIIDLPKRTLMPISNKMFTKEATTKRKKMSSPSLSSPPDLSIKDPLAFAPESILLEEYLDYQ